MARSKNINKEALLEEIQGKIFNRWTIVSWDETKKHYVICRCDYGELHSVYYYNVISGKSPGCRCSSERELLGKQFGRLTVIAFASPPDTVKEGTTSTYWLCRCSCENKTEKVIRRSELQTGVTISCGCYRREKVTKHGKHGSSEWVSWMNMTMRMTDPNHPQYDDYPGRGLTIDEYYLDFNNFLADLGPKPTPKHSIGRILNDLGYIRGNLRWETATQQANNRRSSVYLEHDGQRRTIAEWSRVVGISQSVIGSRIKNLGWSVGRALTTPIIPPTVSGRFPKLRKSEQPPDDPTI